MWRDLRGFTFSSCIFETVIRNRFANLPEPLIIGNDELQQRSVSRLVADGGGTLRLADFTQSLATFGGSTLVLSIDDYTVLNLWSKAIHDADQQLDGIYSNRAFRTNSVPQYSTAASWSPRACPHHCSMRASWLPSLTGSRSASSDLTQNRHIKVA